MVTRRICERYIAQCGFISKLDAYYRRVRAMRELSIKAADPKRCAQLDLRLMVIKRVRRGLDRGVSCIQKGIFYPVTKTIILTTQFRLNPETYIGHVIQTRLYEHL